jgi:hypothetical protein
MAAFRCDACIVVDPDALGRLRLAVMFVYFILTLVLDQGIAHPHVASISAIYNGVTNVADASLRPVPIHLGTQHPWTPG